jgi:hypothetical protein
MNPRIKHALSAVAVVCFFGVLPLFAAGLASFALPGTDSPSLFDGLRTQQTQQPTAETSSAGGDEKTGFCVP